MLARALHVHVLAQCPDEPAHRSKYALALFVDRQFYPFETRARFAPHGFWRDLFHACREIDAEIADLIECAVAA